MKTSKNCPVCMKLMGTHTYSDLTDCMEKLFGMIDVSHSNKNQDLSKGVKLGWFFMNDNEKIKKRYPKYHCLAGSCCFVHCKYDLDGELI